MSKDQRFLHRMRCEENRRRACAFDEHGSGKCAPFQKDERRSFAFQLSHGPWTPRRKHTPDIPGLGGIAASRACAREGRRWNSRVVRGARGGKAEKGPRGCSEKNDQQLENVSPTPIWLFEIAEEECRAAIANLPSQSPATESAAIESSTAVRRAIPACFDMEQVVPSLSQDFDERANEMLAALVAE